MRRRSLPLLLLLVFAAGPAAAEPALVRLLGVGKDSARIEVSLETPATVELDYGEELFAWEGRAESPVPAERHELVLTKLLPNRQYFYRLLIDGEDAGEVLTFRSGRSWIERTASIQVIADTPSGAAEERRVADRLFAEPAGALIALGGDGGDPAAFRALHGRALSERLVIETGGTGDAEALRTLSVSDVAIASVGENPLVLADGSPSPAAAWLATALPEVEGACWSVAASARAVSPAGAETLLAWAARSGVQLVLTPSSEPALLEGDGAIWLGLPDAKGDEPRAIGGIRSAGGTLIVELRDGSGGPPRRASLTRDCPIPKSLMADAGLSHGGDEEDFAGDSSAAGGVAEECDY